MAMPEIEEVKDLALKYDKPTLGRMAQMGQVSPTLAVMAGMMRDRIVQSEMKPPSPPTVAEEIMQPMGQRMGLAAAAQPQMAQQQMPQQGGQGLDQVPVPETMFDEQRMAGGGIVAFQAGGRSSLQDVLSQMSYLELQEYQRTGRLPEKYRMMLPDAEAAPTFTQALRDATQADTGAQYGARPIPGSQILAQKADAAGNIYAGGANPLTGLRAIFGPKAKMGDEGIIEPSATDYLGQGVPTERQVDPFSATERFTGDTAQTDPGFVPQDQTPSAAMLQQAADEEAERPKVRPGPTKEAAAAKETEKPKSYDAYLKEVMDRMGPSTVGKGMREDIEKDRAERKKAKQEAMWMRLVEAGLGIMGGESPYALVNIGKGATNALKGYADDLREQKKLDREDRKILLDLEKAERAEQRDNFKLAAELREKALDRMSAEQRTRISAKASMYAADKSLEAASMLKPGPAITSRLKLAEAVDAQLVMDREYQKLRKQNPTAAEAFRKRIIDARANELGLGRQMPGLNLESWGQLTTVPGAR